MSRWLAFIAWIRSSVASELATSRIVESGCDEVTSWHDAWKEERGWGEQGRQTTVMSIEVEQCMPDRNRRNLSFILSVRTSDTFISS